MFVKFLSFIQLSSRGRVVTRVDFCAEGPWFDPRQKHIFYLHSNSAAKKSTKLNLGSKNITCTSEMRLHFSSAAKKVQNQIWVGRISHVHQKCVLTLTLCVHQKCVRFFRKRCCARYGRPSAGLRARWPNASWWARRVGTKIF